MGEGGIIPALSISGFCEAAVYKTLLFLTDAVNDPPCHPNSSYPILNLNSGWRVSLSLSLCLLRLFIRELIRDSLFNHFDLNI